MSAWIMRVKDIKNFLPIWAKMKSHVFFTPPLFCTYPKDEYEYYMYFDTGCQPDELFVLIDESEIKLPLTLEQIEEINKTWNEFYG